MTNVNIHRADPPAWFKAADFGIFIHWGVYSVPAYAPVDREDFGELINTKSLKYLYTYSPYAEWYANSMLLKNSPTYAYHRAHYGNAPYTAFAPQFKASATHVDLDDWCARFAAAGAKYIVVVTKHHDGFVMYDTTVTNPYQPDYHLDWDYVGELAAAARRHGLRFGVYYSSLLDWTFAHHPIQSAADIMIRNDNSQTYLDYVWAQWHELIDRYHPDILWSDIGYPDDPRLPQLFADYYAAVPDGVVNDRWGRYPKWLHHRALYPLFNLAADVVTKRARLGHESGPPEFYDFRTLEYSTAWQGSDYFETTRGIDKSFGYNQFSRVEDEMTPSDVTRLIDQVRPHRGRVLLNVGPKQDGRLPSYQAALLNALAANRHAN